jgi:hypothetical protein
MQGLPTKTMAAICSRPVALSIKGGNSALFCADFKINVQEQAQDGVAVPR